MASATVQILRPVTATSTATAQMTSDLLIGITRDLDAPVDLYLSLSDLQQQLPSIRFVITRMGGATSLVAWGSYLQSTRLFNLDSACHPNLALLSILLRTLPTNDFVYSANSVRDQILEARGQRLALTPLTYLYTKYSLAYEEGKATAEEIDQRFPGVDVLGQWQDWFYRANGLEPVDEMEEPERVEKLREAFLTQRRAEVEEYETKRNRTDGDRDALRTTARVVELLVKITNDFGSSIGKSRLVYPDFVAGLEKCKTEVECREGGSLACGLYEHLASLDLR